MVAQVACHGASSHTAPLKTAVACGAACWRRNGRVPGPRKAIICKCRSLPHHTRAPVLRPRTRSADTRAAAAARRVRRRGQRGAARAALCRQSRRRWPLWGRERPTPRPARARLQVCFADARGLRARRRQRTSDTDVSHFAYRRGTRKRAVARCSRSALPHARAVLHSASQRGFERRARRALAGCGRRTRC